MCHAICNLSYSPKSARSIRIQDAPYFTIFFFFFPNQKTMPKKSKKKKLLSQLSYQDNPEHDVITDMQVACLLQQSYDESTESPTITDIFGSSCSSSSVPFPGSPSVECDGDGLARRALRGRERWVFCRSSDHFETRKGVLSLKLDHEEVLTAWSDKGSLYIDGDGPQVVPELLENDAMEPNILVDVGNGAGWRVPEMCRREKGSIGCWDRKERVMRYREKRQSRLYSKRIRYEVRKLNAEKRPRIKGRFVKRTDDM